MIKDLRESYNNSFSVDKYEALLREIHEVFDHAPQFRIAETPAFIPEGFKQKLIDAIEEVNQTLTRDDFNELTRGAIKNDANYVPGEDAHPRFIQFDFGICSNGTDELNPQMIEVQGFPSLYFYQPLLVNAFRNNFEIPNTLSSHIHATNFEEYVNELREVIVEDEDPENTVLLELEPEKQMTRIDYLATSKALGIETVSVESLTKKGKNLYYKNTEGKEIRIKRIYNRVIFDELYRKKDIKLNFSFQDELDVKWIGHPNWFFKLSKYTLPFIKSKYVPESFFLEEMDPYPDDLENFVLKPLYSFAGAGVIYDVKKEDLDKINDKENYILQRKTPYAPVIASPDDPIKVEIRLMGLWPDDEPKPRIINNLIRLTKGNIIGVRHNKNKSWVGASVAFFE